MKTAKFLPFLALASIAACHEPTVDAPPAAAPAASAPKSDASLPPSSAAIPTSVSYCATTACERVCPDGRPALRPCDSAGGGAKIYLAARLKGGEYYGDDGCYCPDPLPDGGAAADSSSPSYPEYPEDPPASDAAVPQADAAPGPDLAAPAPDLRKAEDAYVPPAAHYDAGSADAYVPAPDAYVPPAIVVKTDARIAHDAAKEDCGCVDPPVSVPDAKPDTGAGLGPDLRPAEPDAFVAMDVTPDTETVLPDSAPDLGADSKPDAYVCRSSTPTWADSISLALSDVCDISVTWTVDGCSSKGYKVVWSANPGPTYPGRDENDHYHYLSQLNASQDQIDVSGYAPGTVIYVRVCQYLGGACGTYSNEVQMTVPNR